MSQAMTVRSPKLWWFLPPAAALFSPQAVHALYESDKLLHREAGPGGIVAWLSVALSAALVYATSAAGISVAYALGRWKETSHRNWRRVDGISALLRVSFRTHGR